MPTYWGIQIHYGQLGRGRPLKSFPGRNEVISRNGGGNQALVNHLFIFRLPFFLRLFVHRYRQDNFSVSFFQCLTSMEKWDTRQQEKTLGYFGAVKIILSP